MERMALESKEGLYDVYYTEAGERLVVLDQLDAAERVELYPLQEFFLAHLESLVVFYWLLWVAVAGYLIGVYLLLPLLRWPDDRTRIGS